MRAPQSPQFRASPVGHTPLPLPSLPNGHHPLVSFSQLPCQASLTHSTPFNTSISSQHRNFLSTVDEPLFASKSGEKS